MTKISHQSRCEICLFKKNLFILFIFIFGCIGSLLLHMGSSCSERGLLFFATRGLPIAVVSLVVEHGL